MQPPEIKPRNVWGLAAIALLLGPSSLMLWLGRFRLALIYAIAGFVVVCAGCWLVAKDTIPASALTGVGFDVAFECISLLIAAAAFIQALALNRAPAVRPWYSRWFIALPAPLVLAVALAFTVRTFFLQPFNVPSGSNVPNLMVGDYFFVSKRAYVSRDPQPGEMAVFKLLSDPNVDYVKRVIGKPGDHIQMKDGRLWLNGQLMPREAVELPTSLSLGGQQKFYRETLPNGASYVIAEFSDDSLADNTDEYVVPDGSYFTLGDNRDNSQDSRFLDKVGYIPRANFIGPYAFHFWSKTGFNISDRPIQIPGAVSQ